MPASLSICDLPLALFQPRVPEQAFPYGVEPVLGRVFSGHCRHRVVAHLQEYRITRMELHSSFAVERCPGTSSRGGWDLKTRNEQGEGDCVSRLPIPAHEYMYLCVCEFPLFPPSPPPPPPPPPPPYLDFQDNVVGKYERSRRQRVRTNRREQNAWNLRVDHGPPRCKRVRGRPRWRRHDQAISLNLGHKDVVAIALEVGNKGRNAAIDDHLVQGYFIFIFREAGSRGIASILLRGRSSLDPTQQPVAERDMGPTCSRKHWRSSFTCTIVLLFFF